MCARRSIREVAERATSSSPKDRLQSWLEDSAKAADLPTVLQSPAVAAVEAAAARSALLDAQDKDGWTAMHAAAYAGHGRCVQLLRRAGADMMVADANGQQPHHMAELQGTPQLLGIEVAAF